MIYQLPNGKIVHLSVEEYLDLTDQDIQYMMSIDAGDHAVSPFYGSSIRNPQSRDCPSEYDSDIDYIPEDEDGTHSENINTQQILLDDFPDFPDTDEVD